MHRMLEQHPLQRGAHGSRDGGMCAMEMVAWLAGEPHSDEPRCACPVLGAFVRACNDAMNDGARNQWLRPLVPMLVNTRATAAIERKRGMIVVDGLVRELVPLRLHRDRLLAEARLLAAFDPIERLEDVRAAVRALEHYGRGQHAAVWVLQRVLDGMPPARYVAGAIQVARALPAANTWPIVVSWIERMVALQASTADACPI